MGWGVSNRFGRQVSIPTLHNRSSEAGVAFARLEDAALGARSVKARDEHRGWRTNETTRTSTLPSHCALAAARSPGCPGKPRENRVVACEKRIAHHDKDVWEEKKGCIYEKTSDVRLRHGEAHGRNTLGIKD
jgi:hypothetical protein